MIVLFILMFVYGTHLTDFFWNSPCLPRDQQSSCTVLYFLVERNQRSEDMISQKPMIGIL